MKETASVAPSHAPSKISATHLQADVLGLHLQAFSKGGLESAVARFDAVSSTDSWAPYFARGTAAPADEEPRCATLEAVAECVYRRNLPVFEEGAELSDHPEERDIGCYRGTSKTLVWF